MAKTRKSGITLVEVLIIFLIMAVLLCVAVPNFLKARTTSRLETTLENLKQIDLAKQKFAADQRLFQGSAVNDAADLVPRYMPTWPSGPVPGDNYSANAVGIEPTMNGQSASALQSECPKNGANYACPF